METPICSKHQVEKIWKEPGTRKDGTTWKGFFACPQKDGDQFCKAPDVGKEGGFVQRKPGEPMKNFQLQQIIDLLKEISGKLGATSYDENGN